jgi:hypothetical protein
VKNNVWVGLLLFANSLALAQTNVPPTGQPAVAPASPTGEPAAAPVKPPVIKKVTVVKKVIISKKPAAPAKALPPPPITATANSVTFRDPSGKVTSTLTNCDWVGYPQNIFNTSLFCTENQKEPESHCAGVAKCDVSSADRPNVVLKGMIIPKIFCEAKKVERTPGIASQCPGPGNCIAAGDADQLSFEGYSFVNGAGKVNNILGPKEAKKIKKSDYETGYPGQEVIDRETQTGK